MNKPRRTFTQEHKDKIGAASRRAWKDRDYRERHALSIAEYYRINPQARCTVSGPKARKLSDDQVRMVRKMLAEGLMVKTIAAHFGVSSPIISYIKAGTTYRSVK